MGNTNIYYKKALQHFTKVLIDYSYETITQSLNQLTEKDLEIYILKKKDEIAKINFYYMAGHTGQVILQEASNLDEAIEGKIKFEKFIGVPVE